MDGPVSSDAYAVHVEALCKKDKLASILRDNSLHQESHSAGFLKIAGEEAELLWLRSWIANRSLSRLPTDQSQPLKTPATSS